MSIFNFIIILWNIPKFSSYQRTRKQELKWLKKQEVRRISRLLGTLFGERILYKSPSANKKPKEIH